MKKFPRKISRNAWLVLGLLALIAVMIGIVAASAPLYRLFCAQTGFGGTVRRVEALAPPLPTARSIKVLFDANTDPALPWDFKPAQPSVTVKLGETVTVKYLARNRGSHTLTGMATYNVQPEKAGPYFDKIQCFCFTKQTLKPGQSAEFPVEFYIDPALDDDAKLSDVSTITLSYTFFLAKNQGKTGVNQPAAVPPSSD